MIRILVFLLFLFASEFTYTNDGQTKTKEKYSQSVNGGIGLIQTPTARFSNDGELGFGISKDGPWNQLYAKMQFFPWMEAVVRYTEGQYKEYNPGNPQTWKDKGFNLKFRILEENNRFPELALGLIDIGGTGAYSSEYIVASKAFNNIDLSMGLGWGRLNGTEKLKSIFWWRDPSKVDSGQGGKIHLDRFFSGNTMSVFGGIEYFTKIPNLSLKLEYDSSNYDQNIGREINFFQKGNIFEVDSRFNYAMNYRLNFSEREKVDLTLGFTRGNTFYANLAAHSNLNFSGTPKIVMGAENLRKSNINSYLELDNDWKKYLTDTIIWELGNAGFVTHNVIYNGNELAAEISQSRFKKTIHALDLASRILANNAPKEIDRITIINIDQGIETLRSSIDKESLIRSVALGPLTEDSFTYNDIYNITDDVSITQNDYLYPNFYWEIKPHVLGTLQHQVQFYFWQLEALIHTEYSIKKGLYLTTDIGIDIENNYENYTYHVPDGGLYHVRQDRRLYLIEGKTGLRKMALDYLLEINPNIKAKISAGYLEWMYGGFGGEILYIPDHKNWALGLDAYWVKQREYDQKFSFKDYETVTSFLSYYRDIPFYDMRFKLSVGRFLGKDKGAQIDVSRRFETGARVGGIVALTDCDADCVGEGSFNKWIYFELPMDLFYTRSSTRSKTGYAWSPLTKDAGQKIESGGLYNLMTDASDEVDILRQKSWSIKKIIAGFSTKPKEHI